MRLDGVEGLADRIHRTARLIARGARCRLPKSSLPPFWGALVPEPRYDALDRERIDHIAKKASVAAFRRHGDLAQRCGVEAAWRILGAVLTDREGLLVQLAAEPQDR